jgi:acylphosphatase
MGMSAAHVLYSGTVQGVGFRYSCRQVAKGFEVTGWVKNIDDGRVELWVQGEEQEVKDFLNAIDESHLKGLINKAELRWTSAEKGLTDFSIAF